MPTPGTTGVSGGFTAAQLTAILNALNSDPMGLGFAADLSSGNFADLCAMLAWPRDGQTPYSNGIIGPNGTISGATDASPIVITTSAPHGLVTGDWVYISGVGGNTAANASNSYFGASPSFTASPGAQGAQQIIVLSSTTFSLTGSTGNAAYTSGGTWAQCLPTVNNATKPNVWNQTIAVAKVLANIAPGDAATAITTTQQTILAGLLNPNGTITLTDNLGNELTGATWLQALTTSGSTSRKAVKALETRFASFGEWLLGQANYTNPGVVINPTDINAALQGGY